MAGVARVNAVISLVVGWRSLSRAITVLPLLITGPADFSFAFSGNFLRVRGTFRETRHTKKAKKGLVEKSTTVTNVVPAAPDTTAATVACCCSILAPRQNEKLHRTAAVVLVYPGTWYWYARVRAGCSAMRTHVHTQWADENLERADRSGRAHQKPWNFSAKFVSTAAKERTDPRSSWPRASVTDKKKAGHACDT